MGYRFWRNAAIIALLVGVMGIGAPALVSGSVILSLVAAPFVHTAQDRNPGQKTGSDEAGTAFDHGAKHGLGSASPPVLRS